MSGPRSRSLRGPKNFQVQAQADAGIWRKAHLLNEAWVVRVPGEGDGYRGRKYRQF